MSDSYGMTWYGESISAGRFYFTEFRIGVGELQGSIVTIRE